LAISNAFINATTLLQVNGHASRRRAAQPSASRSDGKCDRAPLPVALTVVPIMRTSPLAIFGLLTLLPLLSACGTSDTQPPAAPVAGAAGQSVQNVGGALNSGGTNSGGTTTFGGSGGQSGTTTAGGAGGSVAAGAGGAAGGLAGAAGSAGSSGSAGAGGSAGSGGSSSCLTSGKELCDDFESGQIDPEKWSITKPTASASIAVDDTRPHRGKYSLHIKVVPGQSSTAQLADAVTFPATSNTFYTRAFFYFSPDLPADNNGGFHTAYLLATGNNDLGFVEAGLASAGNKNYLGYSEYYGAGPDSHNHGPTFTEFGPRSQLQVVPMTWICMELLQGGDATTTTRRVWIDGNELTDQKSNYTDRKPPIFSLVSVGVLEYHQTPLLSDVWVDDIRVSAQPIGCDK
jgi:hypothetical protein